MSTVEDSGIGGSQPMPLRALDQLEVAKGYPDIRGWEAIDGNGERVGRIVELLFDPDALSVCQVVVESDGALRKVSIEAVQLQQDAKQAVIGDLAAMREIPSHGDPRIDAVAAATGFRNEELIERASQA